MKKFLSVALSLVMLAAPATNLNVASAETPNSNWAYLSQKQARKAEARKQENKASKAVKFASENKAVIAGICAVGGLSLLGFRATQNKKLDATKWQDNWNDPNKTTTQKYLDAVKILLFGDSARKVIEKAEAEKNIASKNVDELNEKFKEAETAKSNAEKAKVEAENKKEAADKSVILIKSGGEDEKGNNFKGLETLQNEEKVAKETSVNATNARKEAEKALSKAMNDQKEAEQNLKIAVKQFNETVGQFNEINEELNDKDNGAKAKLTKATEDYKKLCDDNGWAYNAETGKCEPQAPCGPNEFRDEKGVCSCVDGYVSVDNQCVEKAKCGENEKYNPQNNTCECETGFEKVDDKCLAKCGDNETRNDKNECECISGHEKVDGECLIACGDNESRNDKNECECISGHEKVDGKCLAECGKHETRNGKNECECESGYVSVNNQCVKKAICGAGQKYDEKNNNCKPIN